MGQAPLIVLEFNELTPALIDRFIASGHLPNFAKFRSESRVYTTAAEESAPYLDPWIQWVTVHSGLSYREHGVFHLNEGHKLATKRIWDVLSAHGMRSLVCGSMNVRYDQGTLAVVIPDAWCTHVPPTPDSLNSYFSFVQRHVLEYTSERVPLSVRDHLEFMGFMARHGLTTATCARVLRQLIEERFTDARWKRAVLLDMMQFDVFAHFYRKTQPAFSTFFLNSTAHYQHAYWEAMEPEIFEREGDSRQLQQHKDAILFGYSQMDKLLGRFFALAGDSAVLVLCTALSQEPWTTYRKDRAAFCYRPTDFGQLLKLVGINCGARIAPVMAEQFHLEFERTGDLKEAERLLGTIRLDGEQLLSIVQDGRRLFTGCRVHTEIRDDAVLDISGRAVSFWDVFYKLPTSKTGMHHPDGIFWARLPDRSHEVVTERIPLTAVAPTLLGLCNIPAPSWMRGPVVPLTGSASRLRAFEAISA